MRRHHPLLFGLAALVARSPQLGGGHSLALAANSDGVTYPKCSVPEYGQCGGIGYSGQKCCEFSREIPYVGAGKHKRSWLSDVSLTPLLCATCRPSRMGLSPLERVVLAVPQEARPQRLHEPGMGSVWRA